MNHIQNLLCTAIIVVCILFAFGPSTQTEAAPNTVEPDQFSCANVTKIPQSECEALVALYNGTAGPNWKDTTGWLDTTTPCGWYGVTCEDGHTTRLELAGTSPSNHFGLQGDLPAEIGNLTELTVFDLSWNDLTRLPTTISNLTNLTELHLTRNDLSSLPAEIGNLTYLTWLSLYGNELSSLPVEIGNLTYLTGLWLGGNRLSSLPPEIGNLTNLTYLTLSYNRLVTPEEDLRSFVAAYDRDWASTQTIVPTNVEVTDLSNKQIELTWTPIVFQDEGGYYEISISDGGSFIVHSTTENKSNSTHLIDGLASGTTYDIRIRTYTPAHDAQPNELWSDYSPVVSATTLVVNNTPTSLAEDEELLLNKLFLPLIRD